MKQFSKHVLNIMAVALIAASITPAMGHGEIHLLISKLDKEITSNPSDTDKRLERAILLCQHGSHDKALADLKEVEKLAPKRPERHYVAARVYMDQEKWELAKSALDQHISALPRQSDSYFLRSQVHLKRGKSGEAVADVNQAIKLHSPAPLNYYLHLIQIQEGRGQVDQAIAACDQARQSLGDLPNIMMMQARLLREEGRIEEASRIYAQIREKTPSLTFGMSLEEAKMWVKSNPQKALGLLIQAESVWNSYSKSKRDRAPMQKLHQELIATKQLLTK
jgi:tetratricopeptide (TPR) repeat protein